MVYDEYAFQKYILSNNRDQYLSPEFELRMLEIKIESKDFIVAEFRRYKKLKRLKELKAKLRAEIIVKPKAMK